MAVDYFLKLDGVTGESTDSQHSGEIELSSWSWGATNPPKIGSGTGGAGTGRVSVSDISCTKPMDSASPFLFDYCSNGKHFTTATLTCRKAGETQQDFLVVSLEEVYISNYHTSGGGDQPFDNFTLAYGKITFDYKKQGEDGTTSSVGAKSWDVRTNTAS